MINFIEVTSYDDGMKVLVPIDKITGIVQDGDGNVFIEMERTGTTHRRAFSSPRVTTKLKEN